MNVLFISISSLPHISGHGISLDLIHEFQKNGHNIYVICAIEKRDNAETNLAKEAGCQVLRVKIGNNKKAGLIEKGLTTIFLARKYISAIKKYYSDVKFDLVLYPTPPVTQVKTVKFIKKRDGAKSYLLLKDIFPQNAVDLGMMSTNGIKGLIYHYFRRKEKELYRISDRIGCMSQANVEYILENNPGILKEKVGICPNCVEFIDLSIDAEEKWQIREKYHLPKEKKIFIYGGNLGKPQGIPFFLKCLKEEKNNTDVLFLIVGDGTEYNKIDAFISNEKATNIRLIKKLPKDDYDRLVAACDVGMIFLDNRFTIPNYPSRLLSYMQAKLPVFAITDSNTDIGKTIIDGKFGWWCISNDVEKFKELVSEICEANLCHMGQKSQQYLIDHFQSSRAYLEIVKD